MQLNFTPFPTITTERLVLRKLKNDDAVPLSFLRSNEEVNKYIDRQKQTTVPEAVAFIDKILKRIEENESMYWAITLKESDLLIGTACLWNFAEEQALAEIGYELHPIYHNKGLITEAVAAVTKWAFGTVGLKIIVAMLMEGNIKSTKVLLKNNFKLASNVDDLLVRQNEGAIVYCLSEKDLN
jgi:ribosomal-protein-alanine N-acetyltransferase